MPVDTRFTDELASSAPVPGGGGASAYCGALAAALASMVGNLTVGKKTYAAVEGPMREKLAELETLRQHLIDLIDEDARAFLPLSAVYRMPKSTPEEKAAREEAMQGALAGACDVPLQIMETCLSVLEQSSFMADKGSVMARSDAGAAAVLAKAAVQAASLNVYANIAGMADAALAARYRLRCRSMVERACLEADAIYDFVVGKVDPDNG